MTVWCHLPTIFKQRHALRIAGLLSLCVALTTTLLFANVSHAVSGVNQTLSYQGRLLQASGAVVPDGYYNIQFKIYQDGDGSQAGDTGGTGGTLKWTESYVNNNANAGVQVTNGFFSVNLGSLNAFGTQVDWNQDTLWLSMNIGGSANTCTTFNSGSCTADGEMTPMKRITSTPYALNSGMLGGKTASNFVQLAQGVQTDASTNTSSIFINKTGTGNLLELQNTGTDAFTLTNSGDIAFGVNANHSITVGTSGASTAGNNLSVSAGTGGSGTGSAGGSLTLQGGAAGGTNGNGGGVTIDAGGATGSGTAGTVSVGTTNAGTINIGNQSGGSQTISIGNNTSTGTTTLAGGTTSIQSKNDTTITTNGTQQARFSGSSNTLYVGNANASGQAVTANSYTIQGTSSTGSNVQGGSLTLQAGSGTSGNANGGNLVLSAGAGTGNGSTGLVTLNTPTFQTAATQTCSSTPCAITQSNVDSYAVIVVNTSGSGYTVNLPNPTLGSSAYGRIVYVTSASTNDFTLAMNGGSGPSNQVAMRNNTTATLIWGPSGWTAAGASNSTTLQTAYNNTLSSANGAELVVSNGTNANGLTIRDSTTNPINGTLLEVQDASAATLFSVSSSGPEYATDAGAETAGGSSSTFPSNTWSAYSSATINRYTTVGNYVATGMASVQVVQSGSSQGVSNKLSTSLTANMNYNVSFGVRLDSGSSALSDLSVSYSVDGSALTTPCTSSSSTWSVPTSTWQKVTCSFTAPSSGITSSNALIITSSAGSHTYYVDNLSVTMASSTNYATDGSVTNAGSFSTNWPAVNGATTSRITSDGNDTSDSAQVIAGTTANSGISNKLSINPLTSTLYRISVYTKLTAGSAFNDFKIRYTRDNGTNFVDCVDYNTQVVTSSWAQVTCYITTDSTTATNPYIYFVQPTSPASGRTFLLDTFSMTLNLASTTNVQIGSGSNGGPTTLLTLDSAASAPIAANNQALYGSMYYDTTLGKIQCYQASGWGSCGAAPDNIITISPEYNNAVMHGPSVGSAGVGTMTSDFCSNSLHINDGTNSQPTICGTNETYNFYKWTSPQASTSPQTYAIYVTYQLPSTFKSFASGQTSIKARNDNGSSGGSASVSYKIYKSHASSGLTACGSAVSASSGTVTSWQPGTATGTSDPSTCGFVANDSIVFEIDMTADANANAYVSNIGFTFSNQ